MDGMHSDGRNQRASPLPHQAKTESQEVQCIPDTAFKQLFAKLSLYVYPETRLGVKHAERAFHALKRGRLSCILDAGQMIRQ